MRVNFNIKSNIKRAIETGELLYLDYKNKNEKNTFYYFGIKSMNFDKDKTKITGLAYNYQFTGYKQITIELERINNVRCIEGTKNFVQSGLKTYMKVPKVNNYFTDEINEKHILDYYADCIENSEDLAFVSTYLIEEFDLDKLLLSETMKLQKEEVDGILKMLNVNQDKVNEKYKLAFNVLSISNFDKEIIPLVYLSIYLDVFKQEISIDIKETVFHQKNISKLLKTPDIDPEIYRDNLEQLREDILSIQSNAPIFEENPLIFKLKVDLSLSPRKDFEKIKNRIYSNQELTPVLKAFFGQYQKPALSNNKNIYFIDNKVNADQIMAIHSVINNDLTYVQGPPGTGKSATIVNMVISSILNNETILITSYTNSAVDNIFEKMKRLKYKDFLIPFPMIRLGSFDYAKKGLDYIKRAYKYYISIKNSINIQELNKEYERKIGEEVRKILKINNIIQVNKKRNDVEIKINYYDKLMQVFSTHKKFKKNIPKLQKYQSAQKGQLTKLGKKNIDNILDELSIDYEVILLGIFIKSVKSFMLLDEIKYSYLNEIIFSKNLDEARKKLLNEYYLEENLNQLQKIFPVFLTTNISTRVFPFNGPTFDLLIMDEAGQCENAHSIVAMSKAKRAAFIGDPNQLLPVVTLSETTNNNLTYQYSIPDVYNYKKTSILQTLNQIDFMNDLILLRKHYRCRKSIVNFANKKYYNETLEIENDKVSSDDCKFINVKSEFYNKKKNTSLLEAVAIIEELKKIPSNQSIGIISPFRNQTLLIQNKINELSINKNVKVGTVHKFQGQEKDVILLSLAIGKDSYKGSYDWIKDNKQLINVATTRAKEQLIVVGDKLSIDNLSNGEEADIKDLIEYTSKFTASTFNEKSVGKKYGNLSSKYLYTNFEDLFFDTLQRLININKKGFRINGQTDVKQVLKIHADHPLFEYATKASFDFLVLDNKNNVKLAIELCGVEHKYDQKVINRDKMKNQIAKENGIEIIYINNRDARRYHMLKNMLIPLLSR